MKGGFPMADAVMERGFVIGCHHGLTSKHLNWMEKVIGDFLKRL